MEEKHLLNISLDCTILHLNIICFIFCTSKYVIHSHPFCEKKKKEKKKYEIREVNYNYLRPLCTSSTELTRDQ